MGIGSESDCLLGQLDRIFRISDSEAGVKEEKSGGFDMDTFANTYLNKSVTLIFDLRHLTRSSIGANGYSLYVSLRLLKYFMRYGVHKV